jgi:LacI family transcriptional regulator
VPRALGASIARPHVALLVETSLASGRDILRGISRYVREATPWALYHEPHGLEEAVPRWLKRWRGDGIIARIQTRRMADAIAASGIPTVDVLGVIPDLPFPVVHVNDFGIARLAAAHLLDRGLRHFGFFGIEGENWSERRYRGFCEALAPTCREVPHYQLKRDTAGARSWERAENNLAAWIESLPKPVGVMVCSDQRGPQLLEACRRADVAVPDEIAVIGVDNDETLCDVCNPPLSSVRAGHVSVGYEAAALLARLLEAGGAQSGPVLIEPEDTVARLSTDMLSVGDVAVGASLRLIREHAHEGLDVDMIARRVGLSRSVLQRRFRAVLKRSVYQEIISAKVKRARELLLKTDLPLAIVADRAGFKHQEYMGAVFRSRLGKTPGELRRESHG